MHHSHEDYNSCRLSTVWLLRALIFLGMRPVKTKQRNLQNSRMAEAISKATSAILPVFLSLRPFQSFYWVGGHRYLNNMFFLVLLFAFLCQSFVHPFSSFSLTRRSKSSSEPNRSSILRHDLANDAV